MRQRIFGTTPRGEALALGTALALALVLRLHGIGWGLPGVYEEAYPFKKAWDMWGFGPLRGFDLDPHWFRYPSLTLYLQMVGQALSFASAAWPTRWWTCGCSTSSTAPPST